MFALASTVLALSGCTSSSGASAGDGGSLATLLPGKDESAFPDAKTFAHHQGANDGSTILDLNFQPDRSCSRSYCVAEGCRRDDISRHCSRRYNDYWLGDYLSVSRRHNNCSRLSDTSFWSLRMSAYGLLPVVSIP